MKKKDIIAIYESTKRLNPKTVKPRDMWTEQELKDFNDKQQLETQQRELNCLNIKKAYQRRVFSMLFWGLFQWVWAFVHFYYFDECHQFYVNLINKDFAAVFMLFFGFFGSIVAIIRGWLQIKFAHYGEWPPMFKYSFRTFLNELFDNRWYAKDSSNYGSYEDIGRVKDYASSVSKYQGREEASKTMMKVNSLDSLHATEQGRRSLDYINSNLKFMSRKQGYNFISGLFK